MDTKQNISEFPEAKSVHTFARTDVGMVREGNEDNFMVDDFTSAAEDRLPKIATFPLSSKGLTLMVSDGMGGAAAGEVASELAVQTVQEHMVGGDVSGEATFVEKLESALQTANDVISEHASNNPSMRGMGATATAAGLYNDRAYIAQVGDSRAYLIRNGDIRQLTRDQSFVNQLVESGKITEEEAETHPRRNVILQALGNQPNLQVVITSLQVRHDDILLLCSDGLSSSVRKDVLLSTVLEAEDLELATNQLVDLANLNGGNDNITVVLAKFDQDVAADLVTVGVDTDEWTVDLEDTDERTIPDIEYKPSPTRAVPAPATSRTRLMIGIVAGIALLLLAALWAYPYFKPQVPPDEAEALLVGTEQQFRLYLADQLPLLTCLEDSLDIFSDTVRIHTWLDSAHEAFSDEDYNAAVQHATYAGVALEQWIAYTSVELSSASRDSSAIRKMLVTRLGEVDTSASQLPPLSYVDKNWLNALSFDDLVMESATVLWDSFDVRANTTRELLAVLATVDSLEAMETESMQYSAFESIERSCNALQPDMTLSQAFQAIEQAENAFTALTVVETKLELLARKQN